MRRMAPLTSLFRQGEKKKGTSTQDHRKKKIVSPQKTPHLLQRKKSDRMIAIVKTPPHSKLEKGKKRAIRLKKERRTAKDLSSFKATVEVKKGAIY